MAEAKGYCYLNSIVNNHFDILRVQCAAVIISSSPDESYLEYPASGFSPQAECSFTFPREETLETMVEDRLLGGDPGWDLPAPDHQTTVLTLGSGNTTFPYPEHGGIVAE